MPDDPEPPADDEEPPPPGDSDAPQLELLQGEGRGAVIDGVTATYPGMVLLLESHLDRVLDSPGPLEYDTMSHQVTLEREPIDVDELTGIVRINAYRRLRIRVKQEKGNVNAPREAPLSVGKEAVSDAIIHVAKQNKFHRVRDYLDTLHHNSWEQSAIDYAARDILGLTRDVDIHLVRLWAISCIARALQPGCQVDTVLILQGAQGTGKSGFFRALAGEFFADTPMDISNKDAILQLHRSWIYEWSELDAIRGKELTRIKNFISSVADVLRAPYDRAVARHARSTVIVGTTNEGTFLADHTGARRFWVVKVRRDVDVERVRSIRDAFWAEARAEYELGTAWHVPRDSAFAGEMAATEQEFASHHEWEEPVSAWIGTTTEPITIHAALVALRTGAGAPASYTATDQKEMATVLKSLGCIPPIGPERYAGRLIRRWLPPTVTDTATQERQ